MTAPTAAALRRIVELQNAIAGELNVADVMRAVTESAREITGADGAVLEMAEGDEMVYRAAAGSAAAHIGSRLKKEGSLSGLCMADREILICTDSETDSRVNRDLCRRIGLRSMVVVPLRRGAEPIGVLKVLSSVPGRFDAEQAGLLELMAGFIAVVMHNAAAFEAALARSLHDPLTGLPNRTLFHDRLDCRLADLRRTRGGLAVLFLDLDGFKAVNDRHGHRAGDELLAAAAGRMQGQVRRNDTLARLGGDEFAVLMVAPATAEAAEAAAERIRAAVDKPFELSDATVNVGVSIGVAFTEDADTLADALLARADAAMYQAKASRKAAGGREE